MATSIVIKVQYGEILRRFSSQVVDGKLDLDMNALREKVLSLFSFPAGSEPVLTYIDEDKDVVTLSDEEDLNDIVRQTLNPLRITVKLNTKMSARSQSRSSGNSTPVREPEVKIPLQVKSTGATEVLNSLSDTVRETILKLSTELGFDPNSPPGYADLLDSLAKMGLTYLKEISVSDSKSGPLESFINTTVTKDKNSSLVVGTTQVSEKKSSSSSSDTEQKPSEMENVKDKPSDSFNVTGGGKQGKDNNFCLYNTWENCNTGSSEGNKVGNDARSGHKMEAKKSIESRQGWSNVMGPQPSNNDRSGHKMEAKKSIEARQGWISEPGTGIESSFSNFPSGHKMEAKKSIESRQGWSNVMGPQPSNNDRSGHKMEAKKSIEARQGWISEPGTGIESSFSNFPSGHKMEAKKSIESRQGWNYVMGPQPSNNARSGHKMEAKKSIESRQVWKSEPWIGFESSFSNFPSSVNKRQHPHRTVPFKRSYNLSDGISSIFHRGVRCDGCGVHPITGPRFKSKVKDDYDLCSICFAVMGSEAEYIRMDHPMSYQHPGLLSTFDPMQHSPGRLPTFSADHSKLESCFIQDVNILDGTIMTPSTQFTKIWRMRNNGAVVWPHGTHLVWIGGNMFSKALSCDLKIPADGCPVDKEIDISVDFTAPVHPGRYVAYWRLSTPSGLKFGQRVWVLIQVNSSLKDPLSKNVHGFNLNWPPVSGGGIIDYQDDPRIKDGLVDIEDYSNKAIMEPVINTPKRGQGPNLPIDNTPLVAGAKPNSASLEASLPVKYPTVDLSKVEPVAISVPRDSDIEVPYSMVGYEVEQTLLQDLEEMGFKQVNLNKKILRNNDYDLEQTLDYLLCYYRVAVDGFLKT